MRKITGYFIVGLLVSVVGFVSSAVRADRADNAEAVKRGQVTYSRYCAGCHGDRGMGDGPVAGSLVFKPADLSMLMKKNNGLFPEERVIKSIDGRLMPKTHGPSDMPVWGQWFAIQALAEGVLQEDLETIEREVSRRLLGLVAYLKTLQQ